MALVVGGPVRSHVQAFADDVVRIFGARTIGTYPTHQPTQDRALDIFADPNVGDRIAQYALDNWKYYGLQYVIWEQRINSNDGRGWRPMENRGSLTANHYDHNHDAFLESGVAISGTPVLPPILTEEDEMFPPYPYAATPYTVAAAHSGLVIACPGAKATKGSPLQIERLDGGRDQRWGRWGHADGSISLVNSENLAWDVPGNDAQLETRLQAWTFNAGPAQCFVPVWVPDPYVERYKHRDSGLFVDVRHASGQGAAVQLYTENSGLNQLFRLTRTV